MDIKDVKSLLYALRKLYIDKENKKIDITLSLGDIFDFLNIYFDEPDYTIVDEDICLKSLEEHVQENMSILEPNSVNKYYDFYTYLSSQEKIDEFKCRVRDKIESNWTAISNRLHKYLDQGMEEPFEDEKMKEIIIEFQMTMVEECSFSLHDTMAIFTAEIYCTDTSPMEAVFAEYRKRHRWNKYDEYENEDEDDENKDEDPEDNKEA